MLRGGPPVDLMRQRGSHRGRSGFVDRQGLDVGFYEIEPSCARQAGEVMNDGIGGHGDAGDRIPDRVEASDMRAIKLVGNIGSVAEWFIVTEHSEESGLFQPRMGCFSMQGEQAREEFQRPFGSTDQIDTGVVVRREGHSIEPRGLGPMPGHQKIGARLSVLQNIAVGAQDQCVDIQPQNEIKAALQGGYDRWNLHPGVREARAVRPVDDQLVSMAGCKGLHSWKRQGGELGEIVTVICRYDTAAGH